MEENTIKEEAIDSKVDFWQDAQEFVKPFIPEDIEQKFIAFCEEKGYNENEARLFQTMCKDFFAFQTQIPFLKYSFSVKDKEEK